MFSTLPPAIVAELESKLIFSSHGPGSRIYRQGERPHGLFLVFAGRIKMSTIALHAKTALLKIAGPGEILNLAACLANEPHLATAEATEPSTVGFLAREDLMRAMHRSPVFSSAIAHQLATRCMERTTEMLLLRTPCSAAQRLAAMLLRLADSGGNGNGHAASLAYTHAELAQLIGTSRETVTRVMKQFEESALITAGHSNLTIADQYSMREMAGIS